MQKFTPSKTPFKQKSADFLLVASVTHFANIPNLLTRAVHSLSPFAQIRILDLGMVRQAKTYEIESFGIEPSPSIAEANAFDAKAIFDKGRRFGRSYRPKGEYVIIGESRLGGTTTAQASITALHFATEGLLVSPTEELTIAASLAKLTGTMSIYEKLGHTADNVLMFLAGFILEASRRFEVVLGGGIQMAAVLLLADKLATREAIPHDPRHISLWTVEESASGVEMLLAQLNFSPKAYYADLLHEGDVGAAIGYAYAHGITDQQITKQVEQLMKEKTR